MEYVLLVVGFLFLIKGSDYFVDGSSCLAKFLKIPSVIIGLTIVAMGTSAPEASVSIHAALSGNNDIAVSNIIGSNIFNGMVVVGICAFLATFKTDSQIQKRDLPVNILVTLLLGGMLYDKQLSALEGAILLLFMICYIGNMILTALKKRTLSQEEEVISLPRCILCIAGGLTAVILGGSLVVDNACAIATNWGVSQNFIGLTIVAIGTSLPELVTSIVATKKGDSGLALGNAVGSNIFNILFILGISALLQPLHIQTESLVDCFILLITGIILFLFAKTKGSMSKKEGAICVILYLFYTIYLLLR